MNHSHSYIKTSLGVQELNSRRLKLSQPLRNALILVDKSQSLEKLHRDATRVGAPEDFIEQLLSMGLIATAGNTAISETPAANDETAPDQNDEFTLFRSAKDFMNTTIVNAAGMRSFFFVLKLEKAGTRAELSDLVPEYEKAMSKALNPQAAEVMVERINSMLS